MSFNPITDNNVSYQDDRKQKEFKKISKSIKISEQEIPNVCLGDELGQTVNYFWDRVNAIVNYSNEYFIHSAIVKLMISLRNKSLEQTDEDVKRMYDDMLEDLPYIIASEMEFTRKEKTIASNIRYIANNGIYENEIDINDKSKSLIKK